MKTETRQYKDVAGNPVTLDWLVKNEPEWAANQIRHRDELELAINSPRPITADDVTREGDRNYDLGRKHAKEEMQPLLAAERQRSNELTDRWAQVRTECGSLADDSVVEVFERIRQQRLAAASAEKSVNKSKMAEHLIKQYSDRVAAATTDAGRKAMILLSIAHAPETRWAANLTDAELADELIANLWADIPVLERKKCAVLEAAINRLRAR